MLHTVELYNHELFSLLLAYYLQVIHTLSVLSSTKEAKKTVAE